MFGLTCLSLQLIGLHVNSDRSFFLLTDVAAAPWAMQVFWFGILHQHWASAPTSLKALVSMSLLATGSWWGSALKSPTMSWGPGGRVSISSSIAKRTSSDLPFAALLVDEPVHK